MYIFTNIKTGAQQKFTTLQEYMNAEDRQDLRYGAPGVAYPDFKGKAAVLKKIRKAYLAQKNRE